MDRLSRQHTKCRKVVKCYSNPKLMLTRYKMLIILLIYKKNKPLIQYSRKFKLRYDYKILKVKPGLYLEQTRTWTSPKRTVHVSWHSCFSRICDGCAWCLQTRIYVTWTLSALFQKSSGPTDQSNLSPPPQVASVTGHFGSNYVTFSARPLWQPTKLSINQA